MIDLILFIGRIALVILLYLFLFAVMKTGIGLVKGQRKDAAIWCIDVETGPRALLGLHVDILGPTVVGRDPSSDIVINDQQVSHKHARFTLQGPALVLEDMGSTNFTFVNNRQIIEPVTLRDGDIVQIVNVQMRVSRR